MTTPCPWQRAVSEVARSGLTPKMQANALLLLDATGRIGTGSGGIQTEAEIVMDWFGISSRGTLRQYLADMRAAGILNYRLIQESVIVFFLAWKDAPQPRTVNAGAFFEEPARPQAARPVPIGDAPWLRNETL